MQERPENFEAANEDPEATLVTPRFDADDARQAHPVVPLAEAPPRAPYANARSTSTRRVRTPRRAWTPALLAVALLAVAALGGAVVATKVIRSPSAERVEEQTQAAPVQTAEAPAQPSTPQAAEAPREDAPAAKPTKREARQRRARDDAALVAVEPAREVADDKDEDKDKSRGKAEQRREREDDIEKQMRKALKHAKGKEPRLVDVLTSP
ncbi:MAG: hypothetical protein ACJ74T_15815 [Pyrinomonadaceae bacterium]